MHIVRYMTATGLVVWAHFLRKGAVPAYPKVNE